MYLVYYIVKIRIIWVYRSCSNHLESHEYIYAGVVSYYSYMYDYRYIDYKNPP